MNLADQNSEGNGGDGIEQIDHIDAVPYGNDHAADGGTRDRTELPYAAVPACGLREKFRRNRFGQKSRGGWIIEGTRNADAE